MEQGRSKLQSEFDEWYGHCLTAEARHTVRGTHPASSSHHAAATAPPDEARAAAAAAPKLESESSGGGSGVGVELTGNKAADDDILAFEKAKEELYLLQRRQAQQR